MDWIYRFNESIEYMEQHLANEIDYGELGKIACCSTYHYQRMFTYMAGIPCLNTFGDGKCLWPL